MDQRYAPWKVLVEISDRSLPVTALNKAKPKPRENVSEVATRPVGPTRNRAVDAPMYCPLRRESQYHPEMVRAALTMSPSTAEAVSAPPAPAPCRRNVPANSASMTTAF